jgi:hypothetical protein
MSLPKDDLKIVNDEIYRRLDLILSGTKNQFESAARLFTPLEKEKITKALLDRQLSVPKGTARVPVAQATDTERKRLLELIPNLPI